MAVGFRAIENGSDELFILPNTTEDWNRCRWLDGILLDSGLATDCKQWPPFFNVKRKPQLIALLRFHGVEVEE